MTKTVRGNVKTSPNCITRDITVQENIIKEKGRKSFATIMVCVIMAQTNAILCRATGSTFSPHTVSQNNKGSGRSGLPEMLKGRPKSTT
eukprot:7307866-Ditylum_brightwellii.AAC.1